MREKVNGVVLYDGPSEINGEPIVCIATGLLHRSTNEATGPTIQTWILHRDVHPQEAVHRGLDRAVCGDCPARGTFCYVVVFRAPTQTWHGYHKGVYPPYDPAKHKWLFQGEVLRLGSYGDPGAVPIEVWDGLVPVVRSHTGYTHLWFEAPWLKKYCMASVETLDDARLAWSLGWRTFRAKLPEEEVQPEEIICPKSKEAGHRLDCYHCKACRGNPSGLPTAKKSVVNDAHGWKPKQAAYRKYRLELDVL